MPSPDYFLHAQDELMGMIDEFILLIIGDIARRIIKTGEVTETALHQMKIAEQSRLLRKDVVKRISQMSGYTEKEIERLFEKAGRISMDEETAVYEEAGMETHDLEDSNTLKNVLQSNLRKTLYDVSNLTLTTAVTAQTAFIQACNAAQIAVQSGGLSYDAAIARAIRQAASQGVTVSYPSGYIDQLDVAVRRAVLTGTNQSCADIKLQYAKEIGSDYVETTAHSGARPSHAIWQGKVFCISGKDSTYPPFYEGTGYGTGPGLCGWNCRHSFHAFVPGVSIPAYTKEMLDGYTAKNINYNGKMYDEYQISQMQRLKERQIRETKRQLAGCDAARKEAKDAAVKERLRMEFEHDSVHLKKQESALKDFCRKTGRRYESARTQVRAVLDKKGNIIGFDRSVAQKAVWAVRPKRKDRNMGEFKHLQIPMQKRQIKRISQKYGLKINDLILKIQRNEELLNLPFFGSTDYDNIGRIDLFPSAFTSEEELVRTIIHERCHVLQLRKHGKNYMQNNLDLMEQQAYKFEEFWYNIVRKRVKT